MAVGKIGTFDMGKDNWSFYIDRLEQYFVANDVKPAVQVATLISVVGSEAYELMVNLCTPEKPSSKSFNDLVKVMQEHLQPKPSILAERFKFRQRVQKSTESVAEYVADLKKLSKYCGFSVVNLKENLRDQFVCGLASDYTRQRLFAENNITFDDAFKLAVTIETAEADAALVEGRTGNYGEVHRRRQQRCIRWCRTRDERPGERKRAVIWAKPVSAGRCVAHVHCVTQQPVAQTIQAERVAR